MNTEYVSGNIFVRQMVIAKAGDRIAGHKHNFDHTTYIAHGSARIQRLNDQGVVVKEIVKTSSQGFNWLLIKAGVEHVIIAEQDNTIVHCIYSHRDPQGEIILQYDGWTPSYE